MSSFVVIKVNGEYSVQQQAHADGYEFEEQALEAATYLNNATFRNINMKGDKGGKIGRSHAQLEERKKSNERITKGLKK